MQKLTLEKIEIIKTGILESFKEHQDIIQMIETKYSTLRNSVNIEKLDYCIDKYVNAELDFRAEGMRGIGRASTFVPRLGAYYRESFSNFTQEEIDKLYNLIQDILLIGYLSFVFLMEEKSQFDTSINTEKLCEAWITGMYGSDPSEMGEKLQNALGNLSEKSIIRIKDFFEKHNMKKGRLFSKDKIDIILWWYILAGYSLRLVESGKHYKI